MSYDPEQIKQLVRQVVVRTLGKGEAVGSKPRRSEQPVFDQQRLLLTEEMVQQIPVGSSYRVTAVTLITPLARQAALERRIQLIEEGKANTAPLRVNNQSTTQKTIALGADHGGYGLKEELKKMLESASFEYNLLDCGTHNTDSVDYPDYAYAVAQQVATGKAWCGIIIDGAGIGSCMVANKLPNVRAAMCYDQSTAVNSREHNNANVLTLGAGLIGTNLAKQIVTTWLATEFGGGRHARRVNKIDQISERFHSK